MEPPQELINWMLDTKANPKLLHNLIKTTNNSNEKYKVFNQIKIIDSGKDKDEEFVPSYLR